MELAPHHCKICSSSHCEECSMPMKNSLELHLFIRKSVLQEPIWFCQTCLLYRQQGHIILRDTKNYKTWVFAFEILTMVVEILGKHSNYIVQAVHLVPKEPRKMLVLSRKWTCAELQRTSECFLHWHSEQMPWFSIMCTSSHSLRYD